MTELELCVNVSYTDFDPLCRFLETHSETPIVEDEMETSEYAVLDFKFEAHDAGSITEIGQVSCGDFGEPFLSYIVDHESNTANLTLRYSNENNGGMELFLEMLQPYIIDPDDKVIGSYTDEGVSPFAITMRDIEEIRIGTWRNNG